MIQSLKVIIRKLITIKIIINAIGQIGIDGVLSKLLSNIFFRCGLEEEQYFKRYHAKKVTQYIRNKYSYICDNYQFRKKTSSITISNPPIFTFWAEGDPPAFIKQCFESQYKNAGYHEYVVLNNKTIPKYCDIPGYIWDKYFQKKIPVQTFSDLLRFSLLHEQGGLWLDSTIFVSKPIPDLVFECDYWQHKYKSLSEYSKKYENFGMSAFAGCKGNVVSEFCREYFFSYWKNENVLCDYFQIGIVLSMGIDNIKEIRKLFYTIPENNSHIFDLIKIQDTPFCPDSWNDIVNDERDIGFSKMNWRKPPKNEIGSFWYEINK